MVNDPLGLTGNGVKLADAVHLIPEELHPDGVSVGIHRINLHRVPPDPEHIPLKGHIVALIANFHQLAQQPVPGILLPPAQGDDHVGIVNRVAQTVNARHRGHHDHISPLKESRRGAVAQPLDLGVDRCILFNKSIRVGDIRLRLVVVVVGDEILHRILRKKLPELLAKLGRQRLVVGQHQGRPLDLFDDLGHGVGLAAAGDAQQHLLAQTALQTLRQLLDGLGLVPGGGVFGYDFELRHSSPPYFVKMIWYLIIVPQIENM